MGATPRIFRLDGDASLKAELAPFCPQGNVGRALAKRRSGLAVDVGAYDGADTISYATAGHEVFSFEASPRKALGIMKLVNASGVAKRVSFWSAALSDHEGTTSFWQFPTAGHSLERGSEMDSIASGPDLPAVRWKQNTTGLSKLQQKKIRLLTPKHVTVPLLTLDGVMGSRTALFVKIDAQGHDGLVILGARALISERRAHILRFELSPFLAPKQAASYLPAIELQLVQSWKAAGEATPRPSPSGRLRVWCAAGLPSLVGAIMRCVTVRATLGARSILAHMCMHICICIWPLHPLCKQELLARHGYVCLDCSPNWVPRPVGGSAKAKADWRDGAADMPFAQRMADLLSRGTCMKGVNRCWTDVVCRPK